MPFQSEKQRRYLWANEPEIARDWTDTYGSGIARALGGRIPFAEGKTSIPEWNLATLKQGLELATTDEERAAIQKQIDTVQGNIGTTADTLLGSGQAPTKGVGSKILEFFLGSGAEGAIPTDAERAAIERTGGVEDVRDPLVYDEEKGYDVRDLQAHGLAGIYPHAWDNKPTLEGDPFYKDGEFQTFQQPTFFDRQDYPYRGATQTGYETLGYNELGNPLQDFRSNVRSPSGVQLGYKTPRTIADQNRVLGITSQDDDDDDSKPWEFVKGVARTFNPFSKLPFKLRPSALMPQGGIADFANTMRGGLTQRGWERARDARRTQSRIDYMMDRRAAGKDYSETNLKNLLQQTGQEDTWQQPKAPPPPRPRVPDFIRHGGGGDQGGVDLGKQESPSDAAGTPFNRGGLAWLR